MAGSAQPPRQAGGPKEKMERICRQRLSSKRKQLLKEEQMPRRKAPTKEDSALLPPFAQLPDAAIHVPATRVQAWALTKSSSSLAWPPNADAAKAAPATW